MTTYKLFRIKNNKLYPLYVEADREMELGKWLDAEVGEKIDDTHVKAKGCGGSLSLRPGWHSTKIPFTEFYGWRKLREYLILNGYNKISETSIVKLSNGLHVKGYEDLFGKIKIINKEV